MLALPDGESPAVLAPVSVHVRGAGVGGSRESQDCVGGGRGNTRHAPVAPHSLHDFSRVWGAELMSKVLSFRTPAGGPPGARRAASLSSCAHPCGKHLARGPHSAAPLTPRVSPYPNCKCGCTLAHAHTHTHKFGGTRGKHTAHTPRARSPPASPLKSASLAPSHVESMAGCGLLLRMCVCDICSLQRSGGPEPGCGKRGCRSRRRLPTVPRLTHRGRRRHPLRRPRWQE